VEILRIVGVLLLFIAGDIYIETKQSNDDITINS
jgi:hypothetical protein